MATNLLPVYIRKRLLVGTENILLFPEQTADSGFNYNSMAFFVMQTFGSTVFLLVTTKAAMWACVRTLLITSIFMVTM